MSTDPHPSPILPLSFDANQPPTIRLYPLSNYTFGTKETQPERRPIGRCAIEETRGTLRTVWHAEDL